ncbi:MAG: tRNA lysidine(34) synthetase TilS [Bacteroidales bacterium]|nr:tRNA lysidine(34) synthetase TilS [Bacteroidales bacterium]
MLDKFISNIETNKLIEKDDKILVAVSGGADSVVLLDLLVKLEYEIAVAHCNFKLRGEDSELDEVFVKNLAAKYYIPLFEKTCPAREYAESKGISIEMAARELRYEWFEQIAKQYKFNIIATAHHANDSVETILMNLSRKTGIRGLTGIPVRNGKIIRPLLFANKKDILEYAEKNKLEFRTDKTNFETDFQRNKIRHLIIPEFEKLNPAFSENVLQSAQNIMLHKQLFEKYYKKFKRKCVSVQNDIIYLKIDKFKKFKPIELFLFEFIRSCGFNFSHVEDILKAIDNQSGKMFFSGTHRLVKERDFLVISKNNELSYLKFEINEEDGKIKVNSGEIDELYLKFSKQKVEVEKISADEKIGFFDLKKIEFPIILRKWQQGDSFKPLGMNGKRKKLSDYFKDEKFSMIEKENVWILESNGKIMWILGHRIDERFKITTNTIDVFKIEIKNLL